MIEETWREEIVWELDMEEDTRGRGCRKREAVSSRRGSEYEEEIGDRRLEIRKEIK